VCERVSADGIDEVALMKGQCDVIGGVSSGNGRSTGDACARVTAAFSLATSGDDVPMVTARRAFVTTLMEEGECASSLEVKMATDGHVDSAVDVAATVTVMDEKATGVCWFDDGDVRLAFFSRLFVLGDVALAALVARRSTASRVLAAVPVTSRLQEAGLINNAGTAATPAGKTVLLFRADDSAVSSSIPPVIGELTALTSLRLNRNILTNSIPPEIGELTALINLDLSQNTNLKGSLPPQMGALTALALL
jgi:hypothetical protein